MNNNPKIGDVVISVQGRDKHKLYAVVGCENNFLQLVDGKSRRLNCPKRKNVKHVRLLPDKLSDDGIVFPWDNSFDDRVAYLLKRVAAAKVKSEE